MLTVLAGLAWATDSEVGAADVITVPSKTYGLGSVAALDVSADGRTAVTVGQTAGYVWDLPNRTIRRRIGEGVAPFLQAALSPDGQVVLTAGRDTLIRAWEVETGRMRRVFDGHRGEITSLAFAPDGRTFLSSSGDNTVRVWSLETGVVERTLEVPRTWIHAADFVDGGRRIVTGEGPPEGAVRLWDVATGEQVGLFEGHLGEVRRLRALGTDRLVTAGLDRTVRIWRIDTREVLHRFDNGAWDASALAVTGIGGVDHVLASSIDGAIRIWNASTGASAGVLPSADTAVHAIAPVAGTTDLVVVGSDDSVRLRNRVTGAFVGELAGHGSPTILGVAFSPDERNLYSGGVDRWTRQWDAGSGAVVKTFEGHGSGTSAVALSANGRRLVTTRGFPSPVAEVWNVESGQRERSFQGHRDWVLSAAFSPDGETLATGSMDQTVRVWRVATGESRWLLDGHSHWVKRLAFSPDGTMLASGSDDLSVRIWDVATGQWRRTLEGFQAGIRAVAFSPSGDELMTASEDGIVRFWNPVTGQMLREFMAPTGFLNHAAYSPDGRRILTGEGWPFFIARLWDARTGELVRVFAGHTGSVEAVAFAAGGRTVATAADVVRTWDLSDLRARLEISRIADGLELRWEEGALQQAPSVDGPWVDLAEARSPYRTESNPESGPRFFRVRLD